MPRSPSSPWSAKRQIKSHMNAYSPTPGVRHCGGARAIASVWSTAGRGERRAEPDFNLARRRVPFLDTVGLEAEALVKSPGRPIVPQDPEDHFAASVGPRMLQRSAEQGAPDPLAIALGRHIDCRQLTARHTTVFLARSHQGGEADDFSGDLRDERARPGAALAEKRPPHHLTLFDRQAVQHGVVKQPAVGDLPRPHMDPSDRGGFRRYS